MRHKLLVAEMVLRGFNHKSPISFDNQQAVWPEVFIDSPGNQFKILSRKYQLKTGGRIDLPKNSQELWAQHKYSVMARDYHLYRIIGKKVAEKQFCFDALALELVNLLRSATSKKALKNALFHMWGLSNFSELSPNSLRSLELIREIHRQAKEHKIRYIMQSTALGEVAT